MLSKPAFALIALLLLTSCTSDGPAEGPPPAAAVPDASAGSTDPGATPSAPVNALPDPGLASEADLEGKPDAGTLLNTAGTGNDVLVLPTLPDGTSHVVVRFVCGSGDGAVLDKDGGLLIGGSCDSITGSSADYSVEGKDLEEVAVRTGGPWRLYVGTY